MTASPSPPVPRLEKALREFREILYRTRRKDGDVHEFEAAIERINRGLSQHVDHLRANLDSQGCACA